MQNTERYHREAAWGGEKVVLENRHVRLALYKRVGGWAWGELFGPEMNEGRPYIGILEHLGEIDLEAYLHPMRLEAPDFEECMEEDRHILRFQVSMQTPEEPCMAFDNISPVRGTVELSLADNEPFVRYRLNLQGSFRAGYRSLRGPWLRVGAYDNGMERDDAIFPGMEWLIDDEWSSGHNFHGPGNAMRVAPHPHKVHMPMMAISRHGYAAVLSWPAFQPNIGTLERMWSPQPVFASPNFIERSSEHVMGLMLPTAQCGLAENALSADHPRPVPRRTPMVIKAEIGVCPGSSLEAVTAWVRRNGMPEPPSYRWPVDEALNRIAAALNSNLWEEGKGWTYGSPRPRSWIIAKPWGSEWRRAPHMYLHFVDWYIENGADPDLVGGLREKRDWCRKQGAFIERKHAGRVPGNYEMLRWFSDEQLTQLAESILAVQRENGDFPYDPEMQLSHFASHAAHAARWKPLGLPGDTVFDLCATPVILLILIGETLGREEYVQAARKTLDFIELIFRPAGGDWWECPLQAPNLLSAAHGAVAYWLGWKVFGDEDYHQRARFFLRSLLPFTYLWQPHEKELLYETKPLFGTTGWHYMAWTNRCVQWQILLMADMSIQLGFDWSKLDPELDWKRYQRGVTAAGLRWLVDSNDAKWMAKSEDRSEKTMSGDMDMVLADVHDPVDDMYGGIGLGLESPWVGALLAALGNEGLAASGSGKEKKG